jgi:His-Xaa-Ser system radical SAM maturase HxsB
LTAGSLRADLAAGSSSFLRSRELGASIGTLVVNQAGRFAALEHTSNARYSTDCISDIAANRADLNLVPAQHDALGLLAHRYACEERQDLGDQLDYLILVPTLRCNLSCTYCQVSRVAADKSGFDWSDSTLAAVLRLLDELPTSRIKIEFQGGEPTLRPDLIEAVIDRCSRFERAEFVICTNLQRLSPEAVALFDRPDVYISTSLDGDAATHSRNRTAVEPATAEFLNNLRLIVDRYGSHKVSALPTIDPRYPPEPDQLIDAYLEFGLTSIFLRPINFQGFARKRHKEAREQDEAWRAYYRSFVHRLIERNWSHRDHVLEETYLGLCLRRIFRPTEERHVDLRSPNPLGVDYVVVDHDGTVYPTDEARMLARSGVIDLSIGDVLNGWNGEKRDILNHHNSNADDPQCSNCAYQPYCGRDLVDDLARYGRIDLPREETEFCRKHLAIFDLAFELIYADDPATRYSVSRWLRLPSTPANIGARLS